MAKKLIIEATDTSHAVYLLDTYPTGAAFEVSDTRHFLSWEQLESLSMQADRDTAAQYRTMLGAARAAGSMGGSGSLPGQVEALVTEARKHRERGEVALAAQCIRTLDDLIGVYAAGAFIGGAALVDRRVTVSTVLALRFGPREEARDAAIAARVT